MVRPIASVVLTLGLVAAAPSVRAQEKAAAPGRSENFETYCSVCHGDDGRGKTEMGKKKGARDLTSAKWQAGVDDARLAKSISKGRGNMPNFGPRLSAEEIDALVKEVRSLAKKGS